MDYKELEKVLQKIVCGIIIYTVEKDYTLQIHYMNDGYCKLYEGNRAQLQEAFAQDPLFGVEPEERARVKLFFKKFFQSKSDGEVSFHGRTLQKNTVWITLKVTYVVDEEGKDCVYATYFDISKQMQMQRQLTQVLHNVPGAVCFYHWNGRKLEPIVISEQYSEMLGTDANKSLELTKGIDFLHVHPEDLEGVQEAVRIGIQKLHKMNYTYRSYNEKQKKYIWINAQAKSIPQPDGTQYVYVTYTDISKDKEIEEKLRESEQMLEVAAKTAGIWYWIYDWKNDVGYMGKRMQEEFHIPYKISHFTTNWLRSAVIEKRYQEAYLEMIDRISEGETESYMDCRVYFIDRSLHWMRFHMTNIFDEKGNATKAIGTARVVDDEKELEKRYEIEKKRGVLSDESLLAHACFNLSKKKTIDCHGEKVIPGHAPDIRYTDLGIAVAQEIDGEEKRKEYLKFHSEEFLLERYERGENECSLDYRRRMPNGKIIWLRTVFHMMREPQGTAILLFEYCYDINRKKTMEIMMDYAVNDDYDLLGSVNYYDNSAIMMFGEKSYNMSGVDFVEEDYTESMHRFAANAVVEEEREGYIEKASIERVKEVLKTEETYEFYVHMQHEGEVLAKKVRYSRYRRNADICLFSQIDITSIEEEEERKREELEEALRAAKEANHSKTSFLSQMSHEIRTPMNAIMGMTRLAKETGDNETKNEYLEKIDSSSQYLLGIINDILDMSRIESGRFELHPEWVKAGEMFYSCINMLRPSMEKKEITFIYPKARRIGEVEYYVDALRIQQIYMNLLNNAMKFTPKGGRIELQIENLYHDEAYSTDRVTIIDNGCGMSEEFLTRVFEPFEQEQNPFSKNVQGTGLGLALVKQIIAAMGGEITVESELGKGSTFSFAFRYKYRFLEEKEQKQEQKKWHLWGKRVLLADDHPLNREIASKLLMSQGMQVEQAVNGQEVVEMFQQSQEGYYDVILMDIRMPIIDGLEATRILRTLDRGDAAKVPVIAMTANAFEDDRQASLEAGLNEHLTKPIDPQKMFDTIGKWIR